MKKNREPGFTLIELLTVISVIAILSGLILSTAGYVNRKGATSRAQTEIKALEAACESYKADNGAYPIDSGTTITNTPHPGETGNSTWYNPSNYQAACMVLYQAVTGDGSDKLITGGSASTGKFGSSGKSYIELKPNQTGSNSAGTLYYIVDPFGFSYGYSTAQASATPPATYGYNSTFDLWSTAGTIDAHTSGTQAKWIKNW
jgi:prepilin-type N-terminal cleavage/methylation domain-containing protein